MASSKVGRIPKLLPQRRLHAVASAPAQALGRAPARQQSAPAPRYTPSSHEGLAAAPESQDPISNNLTQAILASLPPRSDFGAGTGTGTAPAPAPLPSPEQGALLPEDWGWTHINTSNTIYGQVHVMQQERQSMCKLQQGPVHCACPLFASTPSHLPNCVTKRCRWGICIGPWPCEAPILLNTAMHAGVSPVVPCGCAYSLHAVLLQGLQGRSIRDLYQRYPPTVY